MGRMELKPECEGKKTFGRAPISALLNEEIEPVETLFAKPMSHGISSALGASSSSINDVSPFSSAGVDFNLTLIANVAGSVPRLQDIHPMVDEVSSNVTLIDKATRSASEFVVNRSAISTHPISPTPVVNALGCKPTRSLVISANQSGNQLNATYSNRSRSLEQSRTSLEDIHNACNGHGFRAALNALRRPRRLRKIRQARSTGAREVASKYCHICNRREMHADKHIPCGNFARQLCGKSICSKCFEKVWWPGKVDLATAKAQGVKWICPHCLGVCELVKGRTATCVYYGRTTEKRRKQNMLDGAIIKRRIHGREGNDGTA